MSIRLADGKVGPKSGTELLLEGGGESGRYRTCEDTALSGQRMCRMNEPAGLQITHELPRADQIPNVSASPVSCAPDWTAPRSKVQIHRPFQRFATGRSRIEWALLLRRCDLHGTSPHLGRPAVGAARSGCSRKNAHIWLVASTPLLVGPTNHSGSGWPPGQVWPPPLIV